MRTRTMILSLIALAFSQSASSLPQTVSDNRIYDIASQIALGRGYSLGSNEVFPTCFKHLEPQAPSFDIQILFDRLQPSQSRFHAESDLERRDLRSFISLNAQFEEPIGSPTTDNTRNVKLYNLLIRVTGRSYYESIDHQNSTFSPYALTLLKNKNWVSFFRECGTHYIDGFSRFSAFYVLIKFQMLPNEPYETFVNNLKTAITSFENNTPVSSELNLQMKRRRLRVAAEAIGIDKDIIEKVSLFPKDVDELRAALASVIDGMQTSEAGQISAFAISPWKDNEIYRQHLVFDTPSARKQYEKLINIRENSTLITMIEGKDHRLTDQFHFMSQCVRELEENFPIGDTEFSYDPKTTMFYDLADRGNPKKRKNLGTLLQHLNAKAIAEAEMEHQMFLYGEAENGAMNCIELLEQKGIENLNYKDHEACLSAEKFRAKFRPYLEHYCLPELVEIR